jgi:hypothetical protein
MPIEEGEAIDCNRCNLQSKTPGESSTYLTRILDRGANLPRMIQLCDSCAKALHYLA